MMCFIQSVGNKSSYWNIGAYVICLICLDKQTLMSQNEMHWIHKLQVGYSPFCQSCWHSIYIVMHVNLCIQRKEID